MENGRCGHSGNTYSIQTPDLKIQLKITLWISKLDIWYKHIWIWSTQDYQREMWKSSKIKEIWGFKNDANNMGAWGKWMNRRLVQLMRIGALWIDVKFTTQWNSYAHRAKMTVINLNWSFWASIGVVLLL